MTRAQKIAKAQRLRSQGKSYQAVASQMGENRSTVFGWLQGREAAQANNARRRARYASQPAVRQQRQEYQQKWGSTSRGRAVRSLAFSRISARQRGHTPCSATIETVAARYTNMCEACGEFSKSPHLDHDHVTGKFRGWLCAGCNLALGAVNDSPVRLRKLARFLTKRR